MKRYIIAANSNLGILIELEETQQDPKEGSHLNITGRALMFRGHFATLKIRNMNQTEHLIFLDELVLYMPAVYEIFPPGNVVVLQKSLGKAMLREELAATLGLRGVRRLPIFLVTVTAK